MVESVVSTPAILSDSGPDGEERRNFEGFTEGFIRAALVNH